MSDDLPKPLYILPKAERNAAAREVARYCLLPDPRPEKDPSGFFERVGKIWRGEKKLFKGKDDQPTEECIRREIAGKIKPPNDFDDVSRTEFREIMDMACTREAAGRAKGQVRDFIDKRSEPDHPLQTPRAIAPQVCKTYLQR